MSFSRISRRVFAAGKAQLPRRRLEIAGPEQFDIPRDSHVSVSEEGAVIVEFEPVSGLFTRELRPSTRSRFTCHTFSSDGVFLMTGEENGTLRLWYTLDYRCRACWTRVFRHPISAVSFVDGDNSRLIAVDKKGNVSDFAVIKEIASSTEHRTRIEPQSIQHWVGYDANLGSHPEGLMHQFSSDGRVLVTVRHEKIHEDSDTRNTVVDIVRFHEGHHEQTSVTLENAQICVPVLSQNGKSLLLLCPPERTSGEANGTGEDRRWSGIWVVPELTFERLHQWKIRLDGDCALWGRMGDYLLVWGTEDDATKLSVYKTKKLPCTQFGLPIPIWEKSLQQRKGQSTWKARMFDKQADGSRAEVLVCETGEDWMIFSVWNFKRNKMMKEVKLVLSPGKPVVTGKPLLTKSFTLRKRTRLPPSPENDFISAVVSDTFPEFCGSAEREWFGAVSWNYQTAGLSSATMGVTAWVSTFANDYLKRPIAMPSQVMFDPSGRHLVLFGEDVIQAFAPPFLDENFKIGRRIDELDQRLTSLDDPDKREKLSMAYRCLPSKALAKAWEVGASGERRKLAWFRRGKEMCKGASVVDAALSPDNQLLALILRDSRGTSHTCVRTAGATDLNGHDYHEKLHFPMPIAGREVQFNPERIFLFETLNKTQSIAFFSTGKHPAVMFCNIDGRGQNVVDLTMSSCVRICKRSHSGNVLLLDDDVVFIMNCAEKKVADRRVYQASFRQLVEEVNASLKWRCRQEDYQNEAHSDNRISEAGDAVLLAWDAKNKRSIVVTPAQKQDELIRAIQASDGQLSELCSLSASGSRTLFLDVNALGQGHITIGIFLESEQRTISYVEVERGLRVDLAGDDLRKVLSNVFYGVTQDEKTLIVNTVGLSSASSPTPLLKDHFTTFVTDQNVRCIPDHDLLQLVKGTTDDIRIERLRMLHGVSLFNLPLSINQTVFQDAILQAKPSFKKRIMELAQRKGTKLAIEWKSRSKTSVDIGSSSKPSLEGNWGNVLKTALERNDTNQILDAMEVLCSDAVPFTSSAKIMKDSFRTLLQSKNDILENKLWKRDLLQEACQLDVHVEFLNPKLRRDRAVHIETTDSYLKWSDPTNADVLDEMWRCKNLEGIKRMETDGNISTKKASLMCVRIEDAAKVGMQGIIRPLLLAKVPLHFFEFDVVKWVVMYKWLKIWKSRFVWRGLEYLCFLAFFTTYAGLLGKTKDILSDSDRGRNDLSDGNLMWGLLTGGFLASATLIGIHLAIEEVRQMRTYTREGGNYFGNRWKGLRYFLRFKWNWLDLTSCSLVVFVIPLCHIMASSEDDWGETLSVVVALEAILAFVKVWYFAQPFREFGSLVRMVRDVTKDCVSFFLLMLSVSVGFAVGFHVLYRHHGDILRDDDRYDSTIRNPFTTLHGSLLTLFVALIGDFELDVYQTCGPKLSLLTTSMFVGYMIAQMIIMLNFLISVMGDTFDRVKEEEEAELLSGRAEFIDACEASLTQTQCEKMNDTIGKYLMVLLEQKKDIVEPIKSSKTWKGKLKRIRTSHKKVIQTGIRNLREWLENKLFKHNTEEKEEIEKRFLEQEEKVHELAKRLDQMDFKQDERHNEINNRLNRILSLIEPS